MSKRQKDSLRILFLSQKITLLNIFFSANHIMSATCIILSNWLCLFVCKRDVGYFDHHSVEEYKKKAHEETAETEGDEPVKKDSLEFMTSVLHEMFHLATGETWEGKGGSRKIYIINV